MPSSALGVSGLSCGRGASLWILQNGIQASHGCDESSMPVTANTGQLGNLNRAKKTDKNGAYCTENMVAFVSWDYPHQNSQRPRRIKLPGYCNASRPVLEGKQRDEILESKAKMSDLVVPDVYCLLGWPFSSQPTMPPSIGWTFVLPSVYVSHLSTVLLVPAPVPALGLSH